MTLDLSLCIEMLFLDLPLVQPDEKSFEFRGTHTRTHRKPRDTASWRINKGKKFMDLWKLVYVLTHDPSEYIELVDKGVTMEYSLCQYKTCFSPSHMVVIDVEEVSDFHYFTWFSRLFRPFSFLAFSKCGENSSMQEILM